MASAVGDGRRATGDGRRATGTGDGGGGDNATGGDRKEVSRENNNDACEALLHVNSSASGIQDSPRDEQNCKKEICVNYFASVLLGKVPEAANDFFNKIISMTLIVTLQQRLWECSWNELNGPKVVRSLYFNVVSLDF